MGQAVCGLKLPQQGLAILYGFISLPVTLHFTKELIWT